MRLVTFTNQSTQQRIGARSGDWIVDLTSAAAAYLRDAQREPAFLRLAEAYVPPDMRLLFAGGDTSLDLARRALEFAGSRGEDLQGGTGERVFYNADEVRIEAPILPRKFFHTAG